MRERPPNGRKKASAQRVEVAHLPFEDTLRDWGGAVGACPRRVSERAPHLAQGEDLRGAPAAANDAATLGGWPDALNPESTRATGSKLLGVVGVADGGAQLRLELLAAQVPSVGT